MASEEALYPKSDRVIQLLAASICTAIRLRFSREISKGDSIDLARVHDLRSALNTITIKSELHRHLPGGRGFDLAVAEAKLGSEHEMITAVRQATISTFDSNQSSASERQKLIEALRTTQQEARLWAKEYSRFLIEMETLYNKTNGQLNSLRLPLNRRLQAQSELEKLIANATRRASVV